MKDLDLQSQILPFTPINYLLISNSFHLSSWLNTEMFYILCTSGCHSMSLFCLDNKKKQDMSTYNILTIYPVHTSLVVIVFFNMSRQIGHMSSLCKLLGEMAISVSSVMASCGFLCSSYKLSSGRMIRNSFKSLLIMRLSNWAASHY